MRGDKPRAHTHGRPTISNANLNPLCICLRSAPPMCACLYMSICVCACVPRAGARCVYICMMCTRTHAGELGRSAPHSHTATVTDKGHAHKDASVVDPGHTHGVGTTWDGVYHDGQKLVPGNHLQGGPDPVYMCSVCVYAWERVCVCIYVHAYM